ncbi:MAG TPA: ATP-binding protein [Ktedonobacterales bacterium]|nr:ATP-binding protein [Ktedonobacterales bacterium]
MGKPVLIIVNGLPGTGKTTLARRLAADVHLPVFSRDGLYEMLYDALECRSGGSPPLLGSAAFTLLYHVSGSVLAAGQSVIVEQFFGRPELRTAELLHLQHTYDFEPFQILCKTDGSVLLERSLARAGTEERHASHQDKEWIEQHREWLLQGQLPPLALGGQLVEIDTTTPHSFDYADLLAQVRAALVGRIM